jgi:serine/threonine protein kinase
MNPVEPSALSEPTPERQSSEEQFRQRIGRYRVVKILGQGGFGSVYLAHDDDLKRQEAIKVPHRHRIARPEDAEAYLAEARVLASLDHPHIVPVHDVGRTEDGLCFIVTKFIEGTDLAHQSKDARLPLAQHIELVATVAEALHYAHKRGLVHRDVKPDNILIYQSSTPYLVDFGLALKELAVTSADARVFRGGTWGHVAPGLRSALRDNNLVTVRYVNVGFRPAKTYLRAR